jgi:hypothetical protein
MMQDRKYLGMTLRQAGILAGLAVAACILLSVAFRLALRTGMNMLSGPPESTPVMGSTSTPFLLPTLSPTATLTPVPYEALVPEGWDQHKTALIELWMPSDFKNAAPGIVSGVAGNTVILDMALVATSGKSSYPRSVSVSYEPLTSNSLDEFLEIKLSNIPSESNLAVHQKVTINSIEATRLMFESQSGSLYLNDLLFVIQDGATVWYVKYSAEISEFYEMLPVIEESIKTFRMVR